MVLLKPLKFKETNNCFSQENLTKKSFSWSRNLNKKPFSGIFARTTYWGYFVKSIGSVFFVLSLLFLILTCSVQFEVNAAQQLFFEDDFESYTVGTFPSSGGWKLWYSGLGSKYQVIVDEVSDSPTKSLQLLGDYAHNWAAYAVQPFVNDSPVIGFKVSVKVSQLGNRSRVIAQVGFGQNLPPNRATTFDPVYFLENGTIAISGLGRAQSYDANSWYNVTVILDRNKETYACWIDDVLYGDEISVHTNRGPMEQGETTWDIEGFSLAQDFYSVKVYFDDVKLFSFFEANPKLELQPTSGLGATTLVGSGFAPDSTVSVSWNGKVLHTVPSPLVTDSYGNFTAIVSVQNQTVSGHHTVKVTDNQQYTATAQFEVVSPAALEANSEGFTPSLETLILLAAIILAFLAVGIVYIKKSQKPKKHEVTT